MGEFLENPWIQGGVGPALAGIAAALALYPLRLSGLAAGFGFFAAVYLTGQLDFEKKLVLLSAAAALLGAIVDLAFRPTRKTGLVLGLAFGIAACWIFISLIGYDLEGRNSKPDLRELAAHTLAEFDLTGEMN